MLLLLVCMINECQEVGFPLPYFDWMVQNIHTHICIMSAYFVFNVIGLIHT